MMSSKKPSLGAAGRFMALFTALLSVSLPPAGCAGSSGFSRERAMEALNRQVAFGPRVPGTAAHNACRDYLVSELKKTADSVQVQHFEHRRIVHPAQYRATLRLTKTQTIPTTGTLPMDNIVAVINGADDKPPKLLLCAHWDSRPTADQEENAEDRLKPIPGANDGASGVAVLLELSRVLHAKRPAQGVILALFDGEDLGPDLGDMLLGAKYYAKNPVPNKPAEGILLDMIGDSDLAIYKEGYSLDANRPLTDAIFAAAGKLGYTKQFVPEVKYTMQDDHVPLILAGIPTVDLIDFDYPYWHTLKDTPDRCSPASLEAVGKTLAAVVYERKAAS